LYTGLYFVETARGRHYLGNRQRDGKIISECLFEAVQRGRAEVKRLRTRTNGGIRWIR
jgi:hypothetical protein